MANCEPTFPKFEYFLNLPVEIRIKIYNLVLRAYDPWHRMYIRIRECAAWNVNPELKQQATK